MKGGIPMSKQSEKKVSVIVPYYNVEKYFAQCLDSLLAQDYGNYDIYLIDDCGPDGSRAIAERYAAAHSDKIHLLINEKNIGQGLSRMKAVRRTDAEYVMFVDSDDYVAPDYISRFMAAGADGCDLVIAGFTKDIDGELKIHPVSDCRYTVILYAVACCKMYRRAFILDNGIDFSDSRKGEDIYFSLACFASTPRYRIIEYYGYHYRLNRKSTTGSMNYETGFEDIVMRMFGRFWDEFAPVDISEETRRALEYAYVANMVNALTVYNHGCGSKRMREKLDRVEADIRLRYPRLMKNPDLRLFRPKGVSLRIRLGVGAFYWSRRLGLYRALFWLVSKV